MTFIHKFSRTVSCTVTVPDSGPIDGSMINHEWTGKPKPKHTREYLQWCHVVYEHLSKEWNIKLAHVVQTGPKRWEFWCYSPGEPGKLGSVFEDT